MNESDVGQNKHGWYTFTVSGSLDYVVTSSFIQEGVASTVPWHFYYFPFGSGADPPHLFDTFGACTKFDTAFGLSTATLDWEVDPANQHKDPDGVDSWWGHCWGGSLASIILQQPPSNDPDFSSEELEGLAGEFFNRYTTTKLAVFASLGTGEEAKAADIDPVDAKVHDFHGKMREMLRDRGKAFHMDLCKRDGATGDPQIWNQGCYKYRAEFVEDPSALGDPETQKIRQIRIKNTFTCNDDFAPSDGDPVSNSNARREQETEYILIYGNDGTILPNGSLAGNKQNWLNMKLVNDLYGPVVPPRDVYVPSIMTDVTRAAAKFVDAPTPGDNPNITSERLIQLGLQKNGAF